MKISELIAELARVHHTEGDIDVRIWKQRWEDIDAEPVATVQTCRPGTVDWPDTTASFVLLDASD